MNRTLIFIISVLCVLSISCNENEFVNEGVSSKASNESLDLDNTGGVNISQAEVDDMLDRMIEIEVAEVTDSGEGEVLEIKEVSMEEFMSNRSLQETFACQHRRGPGGAYGASREEAEKKIDELLAKEEGREMASVMSSEKSLGGPTMSGRGVVVCTRNIRGGIRSVCAPIVTVEAAISANRNRDDLHIGPCTQNSFK